MQSTSRHDLHVAVILDGNGRWATARGLPRLAGHRAGLEAVRGVVNAAPALRISTLTLYAFSSDNWRRPQREVDHLLGLVQGFLTSELRRAVRAGVRVSVLGRRDRLPPALARAILAAEGQTAEGRTLHLRIALDYSGRDAIVEAARSASPTATREEFARLLGRVHWQTEPSPDVDLLIRTGGERRLSDFLLWECAYAELHFTSTPWPDFDGAALAAALADFRCRERRFGTLPAAAAQ